MLRSATLQPHTNMRFHFTSSRKVSNIMGNWQQINNF